VNWFKKGALCRGRLCCPQRQFLPQTLDHSIEPSPAVSIGVAAPTLDEIRFAGLRRISPAAVAAQITSHVGDRFDPAKIEKDVRTLARLGWFESIEVERSACNDTCSFRCWRTRATLVSFFTLRKGLFLSKVEYSGSTAAFAETDRKNAARQEAHAQARKSQPNSSRASNASPFAIRMGLNELGHPNAGVRINRKEASNANGHRSILRSMMAPCCECGGVNFSRAHPLVSIRLVRGQMRDHRAVETAVPRGAAKNGLYPAMGFETGTVNEF